MSLILGIDPGSIITGYGIIRLDKQQLHYIEAGIIRPKQRQNAQHLFQIYDGIRTLIHTYDIHFACVEQVFFYRNPKSALLLGQARGAALAALAEKALPIAEYAARVVKRAVVGYGAAEKCQVQQMTRVLLGLTQVPSPDAADALAVAICHAQFMLYEKKVQPIKTQTVGVQK